MNTKLALVVPAAAALTLLAAPLASAQAIQSETRANVGIGAGAGTGTNARANADLGEGRSLEARSYRATTTRDGNERVRATSARGEARATTTALARGQGGERRSIVANFVHYLRGIFSGGLGGEVRTAAQSQNEMGTTTAAEAGVSVFINWFINVFSR